MTANWKDSLILYIKFIFFQEVITVTQETSTALEMNGD